MSDEEEENEEENKEEKPPEKKKVKPVPVIIDNNKETNEKLDKLIALLTPPTPTKEGEPNNDGKEEPPTGTKRNGIKLFRNPFDKRD